MPAKNHNDASFKKLFMEYRSTHGIEHIMSYLTMFSSSLKSISKGASKNLIFIIQSIFALSNILSFIALKLVDIVKSTSDSFYYFPNSWFQSISSCSTFILRCSQFEIDSSRACIKSNIIVVRNVPVLRHLNWHYYHFRWIHFSSHIQSQWKSWNIFAAKMKLQFSKP